MKVAYIPSPYTAQREEIYFPTRCVWNIRTHRTMKATEMFTVRTSNSVNSTDSSRRIFLFASDLMPVKVYNVKGTVRWEITPCSLVNYCTRFGGTCCLHHQCILLRWCTTRDVYLTSGDYRRVISSRHGYSTSTFKLNFTG